MTPGEEEIMRIYEDGIYRPSDMIEKPGGLKIKVSVEQLCTDLTCNH